MIEKRKEIRYSRTEHKLDGYEGYSKLRHTGWVKKKLSIAWTHLNTFGPTLKCAFNIIFSGASLIILKLPKTKFDRVTSLSPFPVPVFLRHPSSNQSDP